jgi:Secretion system C-terminal sorting domain/CARDB
MKSRLIMVVWTLVVLTPLLLLPVMASVTPNGIMNNELDDFDVILTSHSFPNVGLQIEEVFNPQWALTRFVPDDDFILQGMRVLVEEHSQEVNSLTVRVYADDQNTPGTLIATFTGDVARDQVTGTTVWLELAIAADNYQFFGPDEAFWISIGTANIFAWNICEDTNGASGSNLLGSSADGGPFALDSSGDWVIEAGGEYGAGVYDLVANRVWNNQNRYHITMDNSLTYHGRILNSGTTNSPESSCEIEIRDADNDVAYETTVQLPTLAPGSSYSFTTPTSWTPDDYGDYTVSMDVVINGEDDPQNNHFELFQQVVEPEDWLCYDDGSYEATEPIGEGDGFSVMFKPPASGAVANSARVFFQLEVEEVELKAYTYNGGVFTEFWSYIGPVFQGWNLFPIISPELTNDQSVSFVIQGMQGFRIPVDTSDPEIVENAELPPVYMLTDGNQWYHNFDINGKPLVRVNFEYPDELGTIEINLDAELPDALVPGDEFNWSAQIENSLDEPMDVYVWTELVWPDGTFFGPLQVFSDVTLNPGVSFNLNNQIQAIPISYPDGTYIFRINVGETPLELEAFDAFTIIVHLNTSVEETGSSYLPTEFIVSQPMPNPFNPSCELQVSLPATAELDVTLFDVMGREIRQLTQGVHNAGNHRITVDATNLSSGMYFVRISTPGYSPTLRKMTLLK